MWGQTPGAGVEMMTFSTFLAGCGVGGGTTRRMPKGALMSGFEKPPPPAPFAEFAWFCNCLCVILADDAKGAN